MSEIRPEQLVRPDASLSLVLDDLAKVRDGVVRTKDWYRRHARRPMLLFRTFGVLTILLSISIPFLGTLEGVWRTTVLPVAALLVAALTGLNSFFQWQVQWQGFRQTQFALEYLLSTWEMEIIRARHHLDEGEAVEIAMTATRALLDQAREVTASETGRFFEGIEVPAGQ